MNEVRKSIGVDVGKEKLDVCYPDGTKETIRNIKSCRTKLITKAKKLDAIIAFEATGPYEEALADECLAKGVKAVRLDAWGTRRFAESQGRLEKTDAIDSEMIRDYAMSLKEDRLRFIKPQSQSHKQLRNANVSRKNLMKAKSILYNQLEHLPNCEAKHKLIKNIEALCKSIEEVEKICDKAINDDERMQNLFVRFQQVNGIGPCTARTMLACCPDIGEFTKRGIAKMCGNAPLEHKSCTIQKKSRTKRGRSDLKHVLHMAAVSAVKSNHILREFYLRLLSKGKPKRVALTAVARKLAILMNTIAKYPNFNPAQNSKDIARRKALDTLTS